MKQLITLLCIALGNVVIASNDFSNPEVGISFTYPENWDEDKVEDEDKPRTICKGIRDDVEYDIFTLVAIPTNFREPSSTEMDSWAKDTRKAFKAKLESVRVMNLESGHWYQIAMKYKKIMIYQYQTEASGYTFNFTFVNTNPENTKYLKETETLIKSVIFSKPGALESIAQEFGETTEHSKTGVMMPKHFYLTGKIDADLPLNVNSWYYSELANETSDYVLIAENYHEQVFGMTIGVKHDYIDEDDADDMTKETAALFMQEESIDYHKISSGPWEQAPDKVYLYNFKIKSSISEVVYFIFYVKNGDSTDVYKFQTASEIAEDLEPLFTQLLLSSLPD